ncbi:Ycf48-like protein [Phycisphaerales bacterium]|nr:Ycf48-like protein [Phycisphaerales bacterium]
MRLTAVFVGCAALAAAACAQSLVVQSPFPTGRNLGGAAFLTPDHGFIVGDNHHLIETANGGQSWITRMATGLSTDPFYTITFASPTHGYVAGNNQDAYRTTNGGATWTPMPAMASGSVRALDFITPTTGFAGYNGACTWTPDGGATWQLRGVYPDAPIVFGMDFRDASVGLASGIRSTPYHDGGIYKTIDGGLTWSLVYDGSVNDVIWLDNTSAVAIDGTWIIRSDDEGATWYPYSFTVIDTGFSEFTRAGQSNTLAGVSLAGDIWVSTDLGMSWWRVVEGMGVLPATWAIEFSDDLHGWVVGANGLTFKTIDGGISWQLMNSGCGDEITDIQFADDQNGLAVTHFGFVFTTHNGGQRWDVARLKVTGVLFGRDEGLGAAFALDANDWWAGGAGGVLFHTLDGGEFWTSMGYPNQPWGSSEITAIHFSDQFNGFVGTNAAGSSSFWRTYDGGFTWTAVPGMGGWVSSIDFVGQRGWMIYPSNVVFRTINGGDTWTQVTVSGGGQDWYTATDIDFCDANNGWVVGWYGSLAKSTNGGASWVPQMQPQNETFFDVSVLSSSEAWVIGYDNSSYGYFYKRTTNGGTTWTRTNLAYEESLTEMFVRPSGRAWFAGGIGKIVVKPAPPLTLTLPSGTPATAAPGQNASFTVRITPGEQQIASGAVHVRARATDPYQAIPLTYLSGNDWTATLPGFACGDSPQFYVTATGAGGTTVTLPTNAPTGAYTMRVGVFQTGYLLETEFAGGLPAGWSTTGLWHASSGCAPPGSCGAGAPRMYFGQEAACNFNTGARAAGILRTPNITLPTLQPGQNITLTFCSALDTEYNNGEYGDDDQAQLWWVSGATQYPMEWFTDHSVLNTRSFNLNARAGQTGRLEWRFDSMNTYLNAYRGWHVDNVRLSAPMLVCIPPCDPDVNCDGAVNGFDVQAVEEAVNGDFANFCQSSADLNNDGTENGFDIEVEEQRVNGAPC